jgi:hypothetical protein
MTMYTKLQKQNLAGEFKERVLLGSATDYEVIISLLVFEKTSRITTEDIPELLYLIFDTRQAIMDALLKIPANLDDNLISQIIQSLEKEEIN